MLRRSEISESKNQIFLKISKHVKKMSKLCNKGTPKFKKFSKLHGANRSFDLIRLEKAEITICTIFIVSLSGKMSKTSSNLIRLLIIPFKTDNFNRF